MPETSDQNILSKEDIAVNVLERGIRSGTLSSNLSIEDLKITVGKQTIFSKSSDRLTSDIKNLQKVSLALENPDEFAIRHPRTSINISVNGESVYKITNGKLVTNKLGDRTVARPIETPEAIDPRGLRGAIAPEGATQAIDPRGLRGAIADLQKGIENKDPEILSKLEDLTKRVEALERGHTAYAAAQDALIDSIDEFEADYNKQISNLDNDLSSNSKKLKETQEDVRNLGLDSENSLDRLSQLENQNEELRDRISQLENKNQKLEKALQTNQQKSQPIKEKVQNFFAKVTRSLAEGTRDVLNGKNDWLNQKTARAIDFAAQTAKDVLTSPIGEKATEAVVDKVAQGLGWVADKIEGREPQRMEALGQSGQREIAPEKQPAIDVPAKVVEPKLGKEESARKYREIAEKVDKEVGAGARPEFKDFLQREDAIAAIALQGGEEQTREIMREGVGYRGDLHVQGEPGAERELDRRLEKARSQLEANTIAPEAVEKTESRKTYEEIRDRLKVEGRGDLEPGALDVAIAVEAATVGHEIEDILRNGDAYLYVKQNQGEAKAEELLSSYASQGKEERVLSKDATRSQSEAVPEVDRSQQETASRTPEQVLSEYHDLVIAPKLAAEGSHSGGSNWETVYTDDGFFMKGRDGFEEEGAFAIAVDAGDRWEELGQFSPERGWEANLDAADEIGALEDAIERAKAVRTDSVGEVVAKRAEFNPATERTTEVVQEQRLKDTIVKEGQSAERKEYEFYGNQYDSLQSQGKVKGDRDTWIAAAVLTHRQGDRKTALNVIRQGDSFQQESDVGVAEQVLAKRMDNAVAMYKTGSQQATATQVKVQSVNVERSSQKLAR